MIGMTLSWLNLDWVRVCMDYKKVNTNTRNDYLPLPFIDQMLERLACHFYHYFLDGYSSYNEISITPGDQEKKLPLVPLTLSPFIKFHSDFLILLPPSKV